jgi:hypothetical protein
MCRNGLMVASRRARARAQRDGRTAPRGQLLDALSGFGDSELVLAGLHENFPRARFLDAHGRRAAAAAAALGEADVLGRAAGRRGDFALLKYLPAAALRVSELVAAPERCARNLCDIRDQP